MFSTVNQSSAVYVMDMYIKYTRKAGIKIAFQVHDEMTFNLPKGKEEQCTQILKQAIQQVNQMNSTISEEWKGQAFQAYLEQYNELYQNVKKFEDLLESINQQLNKYADTVAERDAQDAQSFGF